jgi:hypothetical protein
MAYQIDRFNGTFLVSIDDQTINNSATDLRLVGRNYSGYGEIENENLLHLLENFANSSAPPRAITGQLWYDTSTKKVKVYDGNKFKVVSGAESSASAPSGLVAGDFWYDNQNAQVFVWTGDEFTLVGPEKSPIYGDTSAAPAVVKDTTGSDQQIIKLQVGGEVIAIISKNSFTLSSVIPGFLLLSPGINFINSSPVTGVTTSAHRFVGTAANSDRLNGFSASDFLRSSNPSFTSQVSFKDNGIVIGDQNDLKIRILDGATPLVESALNNPIIFRIANNGADIKDVLVVKGTGIEPGTTGLYDLGSTGSKWKTVNAEEVKATTFYGKLVGTVETVPGPGGITPPLAIQSVAVSGSFAMSAISGSGASNFSVDLAGSTSAVNLSSGVTGSLNNFNIGVSNPGSAAFTTLASSGTVRFTNNTESTSPSTGTLVVTGGGAIGGNLYVSGNVIFSGTGALKVHTGTTGARPTAPQQGMIRFNTTLGEWEGWDGAQWRSIGGDADEDYGAVTAAPDVFIDYGTLF